MIGGVTGSEHRGLILRSPMRLLRRNTDESPQVGFSEVIRLEQALGCTRSFSFPQRRLSLLTGQSFVEVRAAAMNSAIELHDSECLQVEVGDDGSGFVLLDAYVHRSEMRPGWDAGEGGIQRVRLTFLNMAVEGLVGELPAYIYEGSLATGDVIIENLFELPEKSPSESIFKVMLSEDARVLTVSGSNLTLVAESQFRYVEDFSPDSPQIWTDK